MGIFALADIPDAWYKVAALPCLLAVLAVFVWVSGRTAELKQGAGPWKWHAAIPMLLAWDYGWGPFARLHDFLYRDAIETFGPRLEIAHYVGFLFPVCCVVGLAIYEAWDRRLARVAEEQ